MEHLSPERLCERRNPQRTVFRDAAHHMPLRGPQCRAAHDTSESCGKDTCQTQSHSNLLDSRPLFHLGLGQQTLGNISEFFSEAISPKGRPLPSHSGLVYMQTASTTQPLRRCDRLGLSWDTHLSATGNFPVPPPEKTPRSLHLISEPPPFSSQSEIEKLKAENDRLKSESQGSGCSRAPSQVSLSASPRQSMGLSQHSLTLTESTSLGEWHHGAKGRPGPAAGTPLSQQEPQDKQMNRSNGEATGVCALGCVCVSGCASATDMSLAVRLLSCFAPVPRILQAVCLDPLVHHVEFCLIHLKRL